MYIWGGWLPDSAGQFQSIHLWHHHVGDENGNVCIFKYGQGLCAIINGDQFSIVMPPAASEHTQSRIIMTRIIAAGKASSGRTFWSAPWRCSRSGRSSNSWLGCKAKGAQG